MSLIKAFNKVIINFIDDCIIVFPKDNNFKKYKKGLELLVKFNTFKIQKIFNEYSNLYKTEIDTRDENFFIQNDFKEVEKYNDSEIFNVINNIKNYWKQLSDNNKEKIWDYLNILVKLNEKITNA